MEGKKRGQDVRGGKGERKWDKRLREKTNSITRRKEWVKGIKGRG